MKKNIKYHALYLFVFSLILIFIKCTEEFKLDLPPNSQKLVVECNFLNIDTVHYLRLTLSKASFSTTETEQTSWTQEVNKFEPVSDAHVIISDDIGNTYTFKGEADSIYYFNKIRKEFILGKNNYPLSKGYYTLRNVVATPGRTYSLKIKWKDKLYTSSCYMPIAPTIDSVGYAYTQGKTGKSNYYIPHIWFKDNPNTVDYYLFKTVSVHSGVWARAILSDRFIQSNVDGINVFRGESIDHWLNAYPYPGTEYTIEMYSISHEIYNYYKQILAMELWDILMRLLFV